MRPILLLALLLSRCPTTGACLDCGQPPLPTYECELPGPCCFDCDDYPRTQ